MSLPAIDERSNENANFFLIAAPTRAALRGCVPCFSRVLAQSVDCGSRLAVELEFREAERRGHLPGFVGSSDAERGRWFTVGTRCARVEAIRVYRRKAEVPCAAGADLVLGEPLDPPTNLSPDCLPEPRAGSEFATGLVPASGAFEGGENTWKRKSSSAI